MKCPKCGYLGFEDIERCRNCGYEFSLIQPAKADKTPDLLLRAGDTPLRPQDDLSLTTNARAAVETPAWQHSPDIERGLTTQTPAAASSQSELPLFRPSGADDLPLITKASPPRAPLAVRRATVEAPRVRPDHRRASLFDLPSTRGDDVAATGSTTGRSEHDQRTPSGSEPPLAGLGARFAAGFLDLTILTLVDAAVVYFTLQICGLTSTELTILPKAPLVAFLLVQNGGYLVAFTLGGQTLGMIAAGIRVVSQEPDEPLDLGRAFLRTLVWVVLALPAGLGFLTTLFSPDHRGLHDRFAGTRVVRAVS